MCNAPKFGEVEERTGLGGGYNDRGVVEYKEREDSDDEYDEFGRRKKRRRKDDDRSSDSSSSSKKEVIQKRPEIEPPKKIEKVVVENEVLISCSANCFVYFIIDVW